MKKHLIILSSTLIASCFFSVQASTTLTGCAAKQQNIQQEIQYAEQQGHPHRVAGLKKALKEVTDHCTDSSLLKERQAKVTEKQRKVQEREQELTEAKADGRQDKIDKKTRKRDEAREELNQAEAELTR